MTSGNYDAVLEPGTGGAQAAPAVPPAFDRPRQLRLSFTGSGSEYFRIWIVNTLLSIVTLGLYSAWAKVRTLQYFYRNTRLDGATFDYHGKPSAILKGRAIVFVLGLALNVCAKVSPILALVMAVVLAAVFPLLLVRSLRFRMANSSYRGLRFAFTGSDADAYKVFVLWPLLSVLTLGALAPMAHQRLKRYQHNHARFGTAPFAFTADAGDFYGVYLRGFGLTVLVVILAALGAGALAAAEPPRCLPAWLEHSVFTHPCWPSDRTSRRACRIWCGTTPRSRRMPFAARSAPAGCSLSP